MDRARLIPADSPAAPKRPGDGHEPLLDADDEPVPVLSREQARALDRAAAKELGLPTLLLMENAARNLAELVLDLRDEHDGDGVLLFCGPGQNGGDGFACARHLVTLEAPATILLACEPESCGGDAAVNLHAARRLGVPIEPATSAEAFCAAGRAPGVVVDALFGTGLNRPIQEPYDRHVCTINALAERGWTIVAADIPSGLDADTGQTLGTAVRAHVTCAFAAAKLGFTSLNAQDHLGDLVVADLGLPGHFTERFARNEASIPGRHDPMADTPLSSHPPFGPNRGPGT